MTNRSRIFIYAVISAIFAAAIVCHSMQYGKLALPASYDDVAYFRAGSLRLHTLYSQGISGFVSECFTLPPHSPFSELMAMFCFALFGINDWAPYLGNTIIVFGLLLFVDHLAQGLSLLSRSSMIILSLTLPLTGYAIHEFRPDIACGLATAIGVSLIILRPAVTWSASYAAVIAASFGLALLIKPTAFPFTIIIMALSLFFVCLTGYFQAHERRLWPLLKMPAYAAIGAFILSFPHFLNTWRHYLLYIQKALVTQKEITEIKGDLSTHLRYLLDGEGGTALLERHLFLIGMLIIAGLVRIAHQRNRQQLLVMAGFGLAMLCAYAIPTASPVKTRFFGVTFYWLFLFSAIYLLRGFFEFDAVRIQKSYVKVVAAAIIIVVSLVAFRWPAALASRADSLSHNKHTANLYAALRNSIPGNNAHVFLTFTGVVNIDLLRYLCMKENIDLKSLDFSMLSLEDSGEIQNYSSRFNAADLVITTEPGNPEVADYYPYGRIQDKITALIKARKDYELIQNVPTSGGSFLIFRKLSKFSGWQEISGLGPLEGPYPEWNLDHVRWGVGRETYLQISGITRGRYSLQLNCRASLPGQIMTVSINNRQTQKYSFLKTDAFEDLQFDFDLESGNHQLKIEYRFWAEDVPAKPMAVLFRMLQFVKLQEAIPEAPAPAEGKK